MSRIDAALDELRSLDAVALRETSLTQLDPRAKLIATLVFSVVVVSFDRYTVARLLPLAAFPVALAALGDLPVRPLVRKLAIAAPFALLVGLFNPLLDRASVVILGEFTVAAGWMSFLSILLRFLLTVSAALVLVAGTGMNELCVALGRLGVPRIFVSQLNFLFRYAFVLGSEASSMATAHALRSGGRRPGIAAFGPLAGHLLLRAFERAQRIHRAMLARGFDGELRGTRALNWTGRDTVFVVGWCAYFVAVRWFDTPQWLGHVLIGAGP